MPFNGSGVFSRVYNWVNDHAAAIDITDTRMDGEDDGFATGLSNCICKDGQTTITANLPMAGFKHTGVGNAASRTDYAAAGQVQDGTLSWVAAGGTADAITATYSPAVTALVDGMILRVRASAANATTTPTFSPNGITAHTITKKGGNALVPGDIAGADHELELVYKLASTRWELLNPATPTIGAGTVTEAMQLLADNTTNNVSTSKHGYAPKAPNDATKYLDGTGAYSVPTKGMTYLATQIFTSSGTYTPTSGMTKCFVEMVGGGAGSGGANGTSGGTSGGGAEYAEGWFTSTDIGSSQTATIGAAGTAGAATPTAGGNGGTTSLGSLLTAVGGNAGANNGSGVNTLGGTGGTGGTNSGGTGIARIPGGAGQPLISNTIGPSGGDSHLGFGGQAVLNASAPSAGQNYGGGAGGRSGTSGAGALGAKGVIIITEYQ